MNTKSMILVLLFLAVIATVLGCSRRKRESNNPSVTLPRNVSIVAKTPESSKQALVPEQVKEALVGEKATSPEKTLVLDVGTGKKLKLVLIPAGSFSMGSTTGDSDEIPVHEVTFSTPFYMGVSEVTQSQYQAVMGKNPSAFQGAQKPVEQVDWVNAKHHFCDKLSEVSGKTVRLPSEAEWEYACRAGSTSKYCFGDDPSNLGQYAWYSKNSNAQTHPVMKKKPNAWGLYDMHGNVWEWCLDQWDETYANTPNEGSPAQGYITGWQVLRGGSWYGRTTDCRSAYRGRDDSCRNSGYGLRIVVEVAKEFDRSPNMYSY